MVTNFQYVEKLTKKINYTGFDLNPELIKIAKKNIKKT